MPFSVNGLGTTHNDDEDDLDNPLDRHIEIQVTEHQLARRETIAIKVPTKGTTISIQLKPEMRNKRVRLRGVLAKGAGHLFVRFCVRDDSDLNCNFLRSQLLELAKIAWTTEDAFRYPQFLLNPDDLAQIATPAKVVEVMLRHVEHIAPGFSIPYMVPRVLITPLAFAAGLFEVDEEGWVTIKVGTQFFADGLAARAILAHEVCHYILGNSGIRKSDFTLNERYTDLFMYVCLWLWSSFSGWIQAGICSE